MKSERAFLNTSLNFAAVTFETGALPTLPRCYRCSFTFHVAIPVDPLPIAAVAEASAALGAASELVVLVFEQDIERSE